MFFKPQLYKRSGKGVSFVNSCTIDTEGRAYADYIQTTFKEKIIGRSVGATCSSVVFKLGFPTALKSKIKAEVKFENNPEAYAVKIGQKTEIYALKEEGFIYAVSTLAQLADFGELEGGLLYDYPQFETRGYKLFLPAREDFGSFRQIVDMLAYYKYNAIMIEIGGAMEYKRHPEINEHWQEFCKETLACSGKTQEIQFRTHPWHKNSIHCNNAEGQILTHEECRELAAYCRSRGLEVIPECPTYSHCDYIVAAHPEIAERPDDLYPDTYCGSNPKSYEIVFDILEEVIDVFEPKQINIGHDEMYSIGLCEKCKKIPPYKLYARDIWKIHDFLAQKNVACIIWGEKLLKAADDTGKPIGGSGHGEGTWKVPALFPCRDILPKDITVLHWYWRFNYKYDRVFHDRGIRMLYGNLSALTLEHWSLRRDWGAKGGFISNWGSSKEEYMQRNRQYLDIVGAALGFWLEDFEALGVERQLEMVLKELYRLKSAKIKNPIRVIHTTDFTCPYKAFFDGIFIVDEKYILGHYEITYADGKTAKLPVKFGTNISSSQMENPLRNPLLKEVSYSTYPYKANGKFVYETQYENPNPDSTIVSFRYVPVEGKEDAHVECYSFNAVPKLSSFTKENRAIEQMNDAGFEII